MTKELRLGEFELLVLLAIIRLGDEAYGASVKRLLAKEINRDVSIGSLYSTIDRLQSKELISSIEGEPTPIRGGRAKSFLKITRKGETAVRLSKSNLTTMWKGLSINGGSEVNG
ncbi:MAG: helix-turn-helix transcriptional regulator [Pseudomonadales bacterium]|nr:helix-turn-helix transcriptional regulator [Pseudomonadales bacterium]